MAPVSEAATKQSCAHCGGPKPPGRGRLYCSKQCKDNAWEARQRGGPENNVNADLVNNVNTCQRCDRPIGQGARRPRQYCSATCRELASRARKAETAAKEADWMPEQGDNTTRAAIRRRELIRELAFQGNSSRQIGERINMNAQTVRSIARELGIAIPADEVVRRTHRHDSDRILRETAQALEGLVMGASLVDFDDVDPAEAQQWATSLTSSIRALTRFTSQIKEMTQ